VASGVLLALARIDLSTVSTLEWVAVGLSAVIPWLAWFASRRPPRHKKGSVGFGVAISFEDEDQEARVRADFIDRLEKLLGARSSDSAWDFLEFPQRFARELKGRETAVALAEQARSHFLVFGSSRLRVINGKPTHVLNLEGLVRHVPVAEETSRKLAGEFRDVLPSSLLITQENDLFSLQVTAGWVDAAAQYIVGIAALISGDLDYSEQLLLELEASLGQASGPAPPTIAIIRNRLPTRIAEVLRVRAARASMEYQMTRDTSHLERAEPILARLEKYDPAWYSGHLLRAICSFVLRRDLSAAHAALDNCTGISDPTWRYSRAFLHAYEGDLRAAWDEYRPAFRQSLAETSVPVQSEEFIHDVLDTEDDKGHLHFCLGLINHRVKEDLASARRDFARFLSVTDADAFPKEHELAGQWIAQLDRRLRPEPNSSMEEE